jgi:hypothetical protein
MVMATQSVLVLLWGALVGDYTHLWQSYSLELPGGIPTIKVAI